MIATSNADPINNPPSRSENQCVFRYRDAKQTPVVTMATNQVNRIPSNGYLCEYLNIKYAKIPQVKIAFAACPLGYDRPLSVKTKSKPVLGLVLPNINLDAPTVRLRSKSERIERLIGRQDLNLRLIKPAVNNKIIAVTPLSPRSSTSITRVGVLPGVISRKSRS